MDASSGRLAALVRGFSVEVLARDKSAARTCRAWLAPGTHVYVAWPQSSIYLSVVATARSLAEAGFVPVPHIVARNIVSYTQLHEMAAHLREAGVTRALVIGGDRDHPAGPYHSSLAVLQSGQLQKHGIRQIGLACYPEAHRRVDQTVLRASLAEKLRFLESEQLDPWLVSQFCFDPALIARCAEAVSTLGPTPGDLKLHIGIAGPADQRSLFKYALHCGIGASIKALGTHTDEIANLAKRQTPEPLLRDVLAFLRNRPTAPIAGIHIYAFGGIANAASWAEDILKQEHDAPAA